MKNPSEIRVERYEMLLTLVPSESKKYKINQRIPCWKDADGEIHTGFRPDVAGGWCFRLEKVETKE